MEHLACPRCKTTKFIQPSTKFLINSCGHTLCDGCVEIIFSKGGAACPTCGKFLFLSKFRLQLFEDTVVEKEIEIRKGILKIFCKQEVDFPSRSAYNDYLEEIETIIFNKVNKLNVGDTDRRINEYEKENKEQIHHFQYKTRPEQIELDRILKKEQHRADAVLLEERKAEKERRAKKALKLRNQEALLNELASSDKDAFQIFRSFEMGKNKSEQLAE